MANLGRLPPELKIAIVDVLFDQGSPSEDFKYRDTVISALAALSLADRFFNLVAEPKLYNLGVLRHPYLLCWATDVGYLNVMRKILSVSNFHANAGVIRYRPQDGYKEWNQDTESAKQRFDQQYRRDGEIFQLRSDWLNKGDFGECQDLIADYIDDEQQEEEDDDDDDDDEDGVDWALWKRFDAEVFGVVRWLDYDLDHLDILKEPKAVYWFPVHIAARQGNFEALVLLVESGALLNISSKGFCVHASDPKNQNCLHFPDWTDDFDPTVMYPAWTPYHIALCHGHQGVAYFILEICPHISERLLFEGDGITRPIPKFITAMRHSYPEFAELCLERELDDIEETHPDVFDGTLVWRAFWELENFELALEILLRHGADLEHDLGEGHTLLVEACYHYHYREALALIEAGARADIFLHEPGSNTNLEEAMRGCSDHSLNANSVLDLCCRVQPFWVEKVPASLPSSDAALAVVSHVIDFGVDNVTKNTAVLFSSSLHRVDILDFLLKSGGDLHDPDADSLSALTHAASRISRTPSPQGELEAWSASLVPTISIILNHAKKIGRHLEGGVDAAETLLKPCVLFRGDETILPSITDGVLLLISEGLVDVNHCIESETLIMKAMQMGCYQFARGLLERGTHVVLDVANKRDDLAKLWIMAFEGWHVDDELNNKMYRLLVDIDSTCRILKEPYFLATAISLGARTVVEQMEPNVHLDKDWVNMKSDLYHVKNLNNCDFFSEQISYDGWSLLHFAAHHGYLQICRRLVAMKAATHIPASDGETPLSIVIRTGYRQESKTILELLMAGKKKLDPDTAVQYRLIAERVINTGGQWDDAREILAICPKISSGGPLLLHAFIRHCFSYLERDDWWLDGDIIRGGVNVNAIDENGNTPLGYLLVLIINARKDRVYCPFIDSWAPGILTTLIMAGAKPSIRNCEGQSVLELLGIVRDWKSGEWWVSRKLRTSLLYQVMLYRQSIGM
ncbi:hypothetical protein CGCS363_v006321 [Colletotrichum siamense]|uniref:uncharacterized protein n=1 Tax=Colletotrichum siamense TaxID=690259 RepID=UPI0018729DB1|nr:uncharacterized protein CGCS363_v006321 [Colletotrichum siamense]KAF5500140.1 hypothetical protein CGCS363_v006321 [Colletotrichum siamense]